MLYVTTSGFQGDVQREIQRLESLVSDLKLISLSRAPTADDLEKAPLLEQYVGCLRDRPCLLGSVEGHPILGSKTIITSELWVIAPDLGWARTYSRFYRLGQAVGGKVN